MDETGKKLKNEADSGNSTSVTIAAWLWIISGAAAAILVLANTLITYNATDYNKSGVLKGGIMITAYCAVFGVVGLRVLERKLNNLTGNAIAGLVLSVLPIVGGFFLVRGEEGAFPLIGLALFLAPAIWFIASVLALIGRRSYRPRAVRQSQEKPR